jgi:NADH-quinone oxidoreductase subunit A
MTSTPIVAYLALFAAVGFLFVLASLLLGKVVRPNAPTPQKVETYECGEPAVGPGSVQFDLRFYVVALLFLIFEVEVAFFFPPATIFGQAAQLLALQERNGGQTTIADAAKREAGPYGEEQLLSEEQLHGEERRGEEFVPTSVTVSSARQVAWASMLDLGMFFAVLLVGFAYLWRRGDLNWVRAVRHPTTGLENAAILMKMRGDGLP